MSNFIDFLLVISKLQSPIYCRSPQLLHRRETLVCQSTSCVLRCNAENGSFLESREFELAIEERENERIGQQQQQRSIR